jgi:hypothetical protein
MAKMMQVWVAKGQALIAALPDGGMTPFIPLTPRQESTLRQWDALCATGTGPP